MVTFFPGPMIIYITRPLSMMFLYFCTTLRRPVLNPFIGMTMERCVYYPQIQEGACPSALDYGSTPYYSSPDGDDIRLYPGTM